MGKTGKSKRFETRAVPYSKFSVACTDENLEDAEPKTLKNFVLKAKANLTGSSTAELQMGCMMIASAARCRPDEIIPEIIKQKLPKVLASLVLLQGDLTVPSAALWALSEISLQGGEKMCDLLVEEADIITVLLAIFKHYEDEGWKPKAATNGESKGSLETTKSDIFVEAVQLLWTLCGNNNKALTVFNNKDLYKTLINYLDVDLYGEDVVTTVVECLYTVSENNPAIYTMDSNLFLPVMQRTESPLIQLLASGILVNLCAGKLSSCPPSLRESILNLISANLDIDGIQLCEKLGHNEIDDDKFKHARKILMAQQLALEILCNACTTDEEYSDHEDMDCSDDSGDIVYDLDTSSGQAEPSDLNADDPIREGILLLHLKEKVLNKFVLPSESLVQLLRKQAVGKELLSKLQAVHTYALYCMQNLVLALSVEDIGGVCSMYQLWSDVLVHAKKLTAPSDAEILDASTGLMRAILDKIVSLDWSSVGSGDSRKASEEDLKFLFEMFNATTNVACKTNIIRTMASYSLKLHRILPPPNTIMQEVGNFLLQVAVTAEDVVMKAECLDALMDAYADDELHPVTLEIDMVARLQALLPTFKEMVSANKKHLGWQFAFVNEVKTNIMRFIQYKKQYKKQHGHRQLSTK